MHVINTQALERPTAIICDIDGTIADNKWRDPYDMSLVLNDGYFWPIIDLASMLQRNLGSKLLITSARPATTQALADTQEWLSYTGLRWDALFMRNENDARPDAEVKSDIYDAAIAPNYHVQYVLDDRDSVVAMWRSKGLTVLQTAEGNF